MGVSRTVNSITLGGGQITTNFSPKHGKIGLISSEERPTFFCLGGTVFDYGHMKVVIRRKADMADRSYLGQVIAAILDNNGIF